MPLLHTRVFSNPNIDHKSYKQSLTCLNEPNLTSHENAEFSFNMPLKTMHNMCVWQSPWMSHLYHSSLIIHLYKLLDCTCETIHYLPLLPIYHDSQGELSITNKNDATLLRHYSNHAHYMYSYSLGTYIQTCSTTCFNAKT